MPCTYILYSKVSGKRYIGSSREDNPDMRLREHNRGRVRSTKSGRPWLLLYCEYYTMYTEARRRELFLKSGQGRKFIQGEVAEWLKAAHC